MDSLKVSEAVASLKVNNKCDALSYHPQSRLLAISASNLTGATWSGLITLATLSDTYATTTSPTTLETGTAGGIFPPPPIWSMLLFLSFSAQRCLFCDISKTSFSIIVIIIIGIYYLFGLRLQQRRGLCCCC
jgi:hypothetical protein